MSATATSERAAFAIEAPDSLRSAQRLFDPPRTPADGPTLEDVVLRAWEELIGRGRADCIVCGGGQPAEGGCVNCGSELS